MPTPLQGGIAVLAVAALAIAVGAFDGDGLGAVAAEAPAAPGRADHGMRTTVAVNGAGAGSDSQALDPTTSAPMANPFSTFMQAPVRDGVTAGPSNDLQPVPFAVAGTRVEGGQPVVILSQHGRSIAVRDIGMLDEVYEVEAIDEHQVVLLHLPSMSRQVLALGVKRAVVGAPAAVAPADATPAEPEPEN